MFILRALMVSVPWGLLIITGFVTGLLLLLLKSELKHLHHVSPAAGAYIRLAALSGKLEGLLMQRVNKSFDGAT